MPGARCTRGPVRNEVGSCAHEHTGEAEASGIPCVMANISRPGSRCATTPQAVEAAIKIGANVEETACKRKQWQCRFYTSCHYQVQNASAAKAEIVYAAHEALFNMPKALGEDFGLVIIDEAFWQDGLATKAKRQYNRPKPPSSAWRIRKSSMRLPDVNCILSQKA